MQQVSERKVLFLVSAVQFVNLVDFMMVMPMGPQLAEAVGMPVDSIGLIGAAYTFSAFITGLLGTLFLDRFDRRSALFVCLIGLLTGTALGGMATGFWSLLLARAVAGAFGGPAVALAFAVVSDIIPPERRGHAVGVVMGSFSAAAVLGVPTGLYLAEWGGWRAPFFSLAGVGLVLGLLTLKFLPSFREHLEEHEPTHALAEIWYLLKRRAVQLAVACQFCGMLSGFLLIPNLAAYVQYNAGFPRERLGLLYFCGGLATFFALRIVGKQIDRLGATRVIGVLTALIIANLLEGFMFERPLLPVVLMFTVFMLGQGLRNVLVQSTSSKVPSPAQRARFQSLQTAVQHLATAIGAASSTFFLKEVAGPRLDGMAELTVVSICATLCVPFGIAALENRLRGKTY